MSTGEDQGATIQGVSAQISALVESLRLEGQMRKAMTPVVVAQV